MQRIATGRETGLDRQRQPKVRNHRKRADEIARSDADHRDAHAVQGQVSPDQTWISRESALPEVVTDQRHRLSASRVLFGKERPAQRGAHTERLEIVSRNTPRPDLFQTPGQRLRKPESGHAGDGGLRRGSKPVSAAQGERDAETGRKEPGEGPVVVAVVGVIGIREELIARAPRHLHQAARIGRLYGPQGHHVIRGEDGRVHADAGGERECRDGGEARILPQRAQRVVNIPKESIEKRQAADFTMGLTQLRQPSQFQAGRAEGLFSRHTAAAVFLRE